MSQATGAIVNVDHLKVHVNAADGSVDKTKTDILLHFVHPDNNTVMEVADTLKAIDLKAVELDAFFKEFNVLLTEEGSEAAGLTALRLHQTSQTVIIFWLLGACAFVVVLLCVTVCACLTQRARYARQLKAVTARAFLEEPTRTDRARKVDTVPNTNRHASEGSNPVWMTGLDNEAWELEEEEEEAAAHVRHTTIYAAGSSHLDSLDTNVLNDNLDDRVEFDPGDMVEETGFFMTGEVLYRPRSDIIARTAADLSSAASGDPRAASADRHSDSSGRGSLLGSSQFTHTSNTSPAAAGRNDSTYFDKESTPPPPPPPPPPLCHSTPPLPPAHHHHHQRNHHQRLPHHTDRLNNPRAFSRTPDSGRD